MEGFRREWRWRLTGICMAAGESSCGLLRAGARDEYRIGDAHGMIGRGCSHGGRLLAPLIRERLAKFGRIGAKRGLNLAVAQFDAHCELGIVAKRELQLDAGMGGVANAFDRIERGLDRTGGMRNGGERRPGGGARCRGR